MKRKYLRVLAGTALLATLAAGLDVRLRTVTYVVPTQKLTAPVRLAILTDLHSCAYGPGQSTLLNAVYAQSPDGVLLSGDIVDDRLDEENAWTVVAALAERYPCVYVTGNHEWRSGDAERICRQMADLGVEVLRGDGVALELQGQTVTVWGLDDPDSGVDQLPKIGDAIIGEGLQVLLAHRPERIGAYQELPFDLIVSGHAHGGQWRLPGLVNGLLAPNQGLFPDYAGGQYDLGDATLLVSRGLARESTRIPRIFNRPELVVAELRPETR